MGDMDRAIEELQAILRQFPGDHHIHYELGMSTLLAKRFKLAIQHFRGALSYNPSDQHTHYNLACAYALDGQSEEALSELGQAVANGYDDPEHLRADPDLESLRKMPRFLEILDGLAPAGGPSDDRR